MQEVLNDLHAQFLAAVDGARKLSPENRLLVADGRIFTGRRAKEIGLVDAIGNEQDAIKLAAELARIKKWDVLREEKKAPLLQRLLGTYVPKLPSLQEGNVGAKYIMH